MEENLDPFDLEAGIPAMPEKTPEITGELSPKLKLADRISKKMIGVAIGVLTMIGATFFVAIDSMDHKKPPQEQEEKGGGPNGQAIADTDPKDLMGIDEADGKDGKPHKTTLVKPEVPKAGSSVAAAGSLINEGHGSMIPGDGATVPSIRDGSKIPKDANADKNHVQTAQERAQEAEILAYQQALQARRDRMAQARSDGLNVASFSGDDKSSADSTKAGAGSYNVNGTASAANLLRTSSTANGAQVQTDQDEKLNFVKDAAKEDRSYHPYKAVKPLSPNEVKTGSYVPMTLAQGINSDLPGQITARISEDVYDTITGCRLLIPAMSTVVGKYDSKVALGQARMLVVWNTVVFPDGEELNIAGMQGYDTGGYAGLNSEVDNHFWRLFGLALGMSMVTTTVELAIPQQNTTGTVQSPSQIMETALAQQYGQLGAQILGKYMQIQPTLKNYPGERFMIVVPHTIVFDKVWRNRCEARVQSED